MKKTSIEAIVVCGHSGLVLAGAVGLLTGIPVCAVRKEGEPSVAAGSRMISGYLPNGQVNRWGFLDDLISSGGTYRHARDTFVDSGATRAADPYAIILYCQWSDTPFRRNHEDGYKRKIIGDYPEVFVREHE